MDEGRTAESFLGALRNWNMYVLGNTTNVGVLYHGHVFCSRFDGLGGNAGEGVLKYSYCRRDGLVPSFALLCPRGACESTSCRRFLCS